MYEIEKTLQLGVLGCVSPERPLPPECSTPKKPRERRLGLDVAESSWWGTVLLGQGHQLQAVEGVFTHAHILECVVPSRALTPHAGHCPGHLFGVQAKVLQQDLALLQGHTHARPVLGTLAAGEAQAPHATARLHGQVEDLNVLALTSAGMALELLDQIRQGHLPGLDASHSWCFVFWHWKLLELLVIFLQRCSPIDVDAFLEALVTDLFGQCGLLIDAHVEEHGNNTELKTASVGHSGHHRLWRR